MMRRWAAPCAAFAFTLAVVASSILGSWQLFDNNGAARQSSVAGARVTNDATYESAVALDRAAARSLDTVRAAVSRHDTVAPPPTTGDVLTFFQALLYGPPPAAQPQPTVGEVLVFFNALLYEPGPTPPSPTVAETLIFFHALLYGGESTATPPQSVAPSPPAPVPARRATAIPVPATPVPAPTAPPPPPPPPAATNDADVWTEAAFTAAVWDAVNARRAEHGLGAVSTEPLLHAAARDYAVLMADARWFSHTGPDGSSFVDRIVAAGFPFTVAVGEVLAMGSHGWPADEVVEAWMDSPPHREQLLSGEYTRAGLECAFSHENGALMVRCVMEFAAS
jgi:uncharacterized protein YkwD